MKRPAEDGEELTAKRPRTLPPIGHVAQENHHVFISLQGSSERVGKLFEGRHSVVFIRGGVATGKTTLAEHLAGQFPDKYVMVPFTNAGEESAWERRTVEAIVKATRQNVNTDQLDVALELAANANLTLVYDEAHTLFFLTKAMHGTVQEQRRLSTKGFAFLSIRRRFHCIKAECGYTH